MQTLRNRLRTWATIAGIPFAVAAVVATYFFVSWQVRAAPEQPAPIDHEVMTKKGVSCLFCHSDALKSPAAGMPSLEKCMGCHRVVKTGSPKIEEIAAYWNRQEPIPWIRVNQLPRFVYFSHRVHVNSGLNCERCHGEVAHMQAAEPVTKMNMGWCLDCHKQQPDAEHLRDCVVCHQ
jgi:c(7)-type cytochrome triheme protein